MSLKKREEYVVRRLYVRVESVVQFEGIVVVKLDWIDKVEET